MLKLSRVPSRWLLPVLCCGGLSYGASIDLTRINGTTLSVTASIALPEPFTVVDLHPVHGRTFRALMQAEITRARQRGQHPFLEIGGSSCGMCNALHKRLDARPLAPRVRAAFSGTDIIRIAIEEWPDALETLGLTSEQRVPVYVSIDTAGHVTRVLSVDYWTLRNLDADTASTLKRFFRADRAWQQPAPPIPKIMRHVLCRPRGSRWKTPGRLAPETQSLAIDPHPLTIPEVPSTGGRHRTGR